MSLGLGVDIGGTGTKAALVDLETGELRSERLRLPTPQPAGPHELGEAVAKLVGMLGWDGPVGCAFPGPIKQGVVQWVMHLDDSWTDLNVEQLMGERLGTQVTAINDADAAGVAEMRYGAGAGRRGTVCVLTFGTGIGSVLFVDGMRVPNTEFGHLYLAGHDEVAESWTSARAREIHDLDWQQWGERVQRYLQHLEKILNPDLFIAGGGVSKRFEKWGKFIHLKTDLVPAQLRNNAGIAGAALHAAEAEADINAHTDTPPHTPPHD